MCFRNIPTSGEDFRNKERTWEGFEKALNVIGLNGKDVLARLQKNLSAYENVKTQNLLCQQAYLEYSSDSKTEVEKHTEPRTIKLRENKKVVLRGRVNTPKEDTTKATRATSSKPAKELEELIKALRNREYNTLTEKRTWEERVDYLQKVEARWAVKIKGSVGREIKRNLPTPCPSCSNRRKRTTKTVQDILSGSEKSAWKNPRPWMKKKSDTSQGIEKLIKGKVGRSLVRSTVRLVNARAKVDKKKIVIESEQSSGSDQEKAKKSTKKFGCTAECPIMYKEKGKMRKCESLCRIMTRHRREDCRCKEHKGVHDNEKKKKMSKKEKKTPKEKLKSYDSLTPAEEKRLKEKYQEIKRRMKEDRKFTKTWEALEKIKRDETKGKLIKKARRILDESSSEDKRQRKSQKTD